MKTEKYLYHRIDVVFTGVDASKPYSFEVYHHTTGRRLNLNNASFESEQEAGLEARKFIDLYESEGGE